MERIIVTRNIPGVKEAAKQLPQDWEVWVNPSESSLSRDELLERSANATALLVVGDQIDREALSLMPHVKVLSNYGVGLDNIDLAAAEEKGVIVKNLPNEVSYSTAELAIALMLACVRRIPEADRLVRRENPFSWTPTIVIGNNLQGKTLGIIGFGRIGQLVAKMAQAFDMPIIYYNRSRKPEAEKLYNAQYRDLPDLLKEADVVSLHVPGGSETQNLIGEPELQLMKSSAMLINVARGTVVDEAALAAALKEKRIAAAGLDVYQNEPAVNPELIALDNVVLTPHIGTTTWETRTAMTKKAIDNIYKVLK